MACTAPNVDLIGILNRAANVHKDAAVRPLAYSSFVPTQVLSAAPHSSKAVPQKAGKTVVKNAKKRTWKKPKDKPKRPLSAYNIFFKEERERLVSSGKKTQATTTTGGEKKRRHRKSHGKIGFAALAQNIAAKWKNLDGNARCPFEEKASLEKARYKKQIDEWNRTQKIKKLQEKHQPQQVDSAPTSSPVEVPSSSAVSGGNDQAMPQPSMHKAPLDQPLEAFASGMNFEPIHLISLKGMMTATKHASHPTGFKSGLPPPMMPMSLETNVPSAHPAPLNTFQEKALGDLEGLDELDAHIDELLNESFFDGSQIPGPAKSELQEMPLFQSDAKTRGILSSIDKLDNELDAEFMDFLSEF